MTDPKYMRPGFNFATGKLVEELGELQVRIGNLQSALGKMLRFGPDSVNPELPPEEQETNIQWIHREMDSVIGAIANFKKEDIIRVEELEKIKISDTSKDEMIKQLRLLKTKEEGIGMSYRDPSPSSGQMPSINLYGDRARVAIWLFKNADQIADMLEYYDLEIRRTTPLYRKGVTTLIYNLIESSMWSPASGTVIWNEDKVSAMRNQVSRLTEGIVEIIFPKPSKE